MSESVAISNGAGTWRRQGLERRDCLQIWQVFCCTPVWFCFGFTGREQWVLPRPVHQQVGLAAMSVCARGELRRALSPSSLCRFISKAHTLSGLNCSHSWGKWVTFYNRKGQSHSKSHNKSQKSKLGKRAIRKFHSIPGTTPQWSEHLFLLKIRSLKLLCMEAFFCHIYIIRFALNAAENKLIKKRYDFYGHGVVLLPALGWTILFNPIPQ